MSHEDVDLSYRPGSWDTAADTWRTPSSRHMERHAGPDARLRRAPRPAQPRVDLPRRTRRSRSCCGRCPATSLQPGCRAHFARAGRLGTFLHAKVAAAAGLPRCCGKRRRPADRASVAAPSGRCSSGGGCRLKRREKAFDVELARGSPMTRRLTAVIVNYNAGEELRQALQSIGGRQRTRGMGRPWSWTTRRPTAARHRASSSTACDADSQRAGTSVSAGREPGAGRPARRSCSIRIPTAGSNRAPSGR